MEYEKINLSPQKKDCGCKEQKKICSSNKCNKIDIPKECGNPQYFKVDNYFSELIHDWEKEAARYNLGIQELEGIEYITEPTVIGTQLSKVVFTYRKGHELITKEFICAPKGDKGDKGDPGIRGLLGLPGRKGDPGITPVLNSVELSWSDNDEFAEFLKITDNEYKLILQLRRPDTTPALLSIINLLNNIIRTLGSLYVTKDDFEIYKLTLPQYATLNDLNYNLTITENVLYLKRNNAVISSIQIPTIEYTLPRATNNTLGGIKTGYIKNEDKYPVELDENNKAYVEVPLADTTTIENSDENRALVNAWVNAATASILNSLNATLNANNADILALKAWKVRVTDSNGNVVALDLTTDAIIAALLLEDRLSGLVLDVMKNQNALILKEGENGAALILKIENGESSTAIESDKIYLLGKTIAENISAQNLTLSGKVKATNAEITGSIKLNSNLYAYNSNLNLPFAETGMLGYLIIDDSNRHVVSGSGSKFVIFVDGQKQMSDNLTFDSNGIYIFAAYKTLNDNLWIVSQSPIKTIIRTSGGNSNVGYEPVTISDSGVISVVAQPMNLNGHTYGYTYTVTIPVTSPTTPHTYMGSFSLNPDLMEANFLTEGRSSDVNLDKSWVGNRSYSDNKITFAFLVYTTDESNIGETIQIGFELNGNYEYTSVATNDKVETNTTISMITYLTGLFNAEGSYIALMYCDAASSDSSSNNIVLKNGTIIDPNTNSVLGELTTDNNTVTVYSISQLPFNVSYNGRTYNISGYNDANGFVFANTDIDPDPIDVTPNT